MLAWLLSASGRVEAEPRSKNPEDPAFDTRVKSDAQLQRESAEAVSVYTTTQAKLESADLGDLLNRVPGVAIARTGGLGSEMRLSLNGLSNEQIRVFWNGLPLEIAGFAFGVASIPVGLVEKLEIYRGVVPLRFGADALGGAVNLVSGSRFYSTGGSASFQVGSFSTARGAVAVHAYHRPTGLFGAATAFLDSTKNNYDIDVQVPDARGRLQDATVPRFHDAYIARGAIVDFGVASRPWASRFIARAFYSDYSKQLQNNPLQTIPYGEVKYDESLVGASLQAEQPEAFGADVGVAAVWSYSRRTTDFTDLSRNAYDWYGNIIAVRPRAGEIDGNARDLTVYRDSVFGRLGIDWRVRPNHVLFISSTASYVTSHGVSKAGLLPNERDPLAAHRTLFKLVSGVEYKAKLFRDRVENILFVKHYYLSAAATELLTGQVLLPVNLNENTAGAGDGVRVRLWRQNFYAKFSYEYATRLPNQTEVFGDGILVSPNPTLLPERSHNANLSLTSLHPHTRGGSFESELNAFVRASENLIVLLGDLQQFSYNNVYSARGLGVEASLRWLSPRDFVVLESALTYQDIRNSSSAGSYAVYQGDRVPNMPWLFVHASARGQLRSLLLTMDQLALTLYLRYVHAFYRDWESIGAPQYKQVVDTQVAPSLSLTYGVRDQKTAATLAFDIENFTNARLFDVYGVQRPGRAFYGKATVEF